MEKSFLLRRISFLFVLALMVLPIVNLGFYFPFQLISWDPFLLQVIKGALAQTALSVFFTLSLGGLGAFGLIYIRTRVSRRTFQLISYLTLLPSFIPPIIMVVVGAKSLGFLPTGLFGVVFFHVLMNLGLLSFIMYKIIQRKSQIWVREALVANVSPIHFVFFGLLPELKNDIKVLIFYFFTLYFFSFSIPFLVGGSFYGGIEVFIYEKVLFLGQWGEALQYSITLFILLLLCSSFLGGQDEDGLFQPLPEDTPQAYLASKILMILPFLPILLLLFGLAQSVTLAGSDFDLASFLQSLRGTFLLGLLTGTLLFSLFSLLAYSYFTESMSKLFTAMIHPGWVIVGFSFLLMWGESSWAVFVKISLALSILYLPFLYRLSFLQSLKDLKQQVKVSQTFPVPWSKVFREVIWPQCLPNICILSGLGALWACGDFALTGILIGSTDSTTLAYEMKSLISSYRLEQAIVLLVPLLISSSIVFLIFQGISYVGRRNITS